MEWRNGSEVSEWSMLQPLIRPAGFEMPKTCFTTHPSNSWVDCGARKWTRAFILSLWFYALRPAILLFVSTCTDWRHYSWIQKHKSQNNRTSGITSESSFCLLQWQRDRLHMHAVISDRPGDCNLTPVSPWYQDGAMTDDAEPPSPVSRQWWWQSLLSIILMFLWINQS